jgi:hypothetical protein
MEEFRVLTAEMYQAIVAIVDDRLREVRVTREGFERLEGAITRLAEAQARTEERVGRLETRMDRVEVALERLAEAKARTEARVEQLAQAQGRTEAALQQLTRQVGGLSETVGGDIEDIAYIVLYDVLKREFGWDVGVLERSRQQWNGEPEEINIFWPRERSSPPGPDNLDCRGGEAQSDVAGGRAVRTAGGGGPAAFGGAGVCRVLCLSSPAGGSRPAEGVGHSAALLLWPFRLI